jgi:sugar lactone lactonase YvrE
VWHPDGYLLFSDIPASIIYRWRPGQDAKPYVNPSRQSNGLTLDRQGRLLACEHAGRQVSRQADDGSM